MSIVLLEPLVRRWYCPRCRVETATKRRDIHTEFHTCPKTGFMNIPMVLEGTKAKIEPHLREDYVGAEVVQTDADGRPIMNVVTTRDDGEDCTVYAPMAVARVREE